MKKTNLFFNIGAMIGAIFSVFLLSFAIYAWSGPTAPPPGGVVGGVRVTSGTSAERPVPAYKGMIRYNTTSHHLEYYNEERDDWFKLVAVRADFAATGGQIHTFVGDGINGVAGQEYRVHVFSQDGNFTVTSGHGEVEYLVIGGGGSGGAGAGSGGGGAGAFLSGGATVAEGSYAVVVGVGGVSRTTRHNVGFNGESSFFGSIEAIGGGRGAAYGQNSPGAGGSGGGGGGYNAPSAGLATPGPWLGNNGGPGTGGTAYHTGSGGGGAGDVGKAPMNGSMAGGDGIESCILGTCYFWAGGGGGAQHNSTVLCSGCSRNGGKGGGGAGGAPYGWGSGVGGGYAYNNGENNTGGNGGNGGRFTGSGGGGGGNDGAYQVSGAGGSGIVVVRYKI